MRARFINYATGETRYVVVDTPNLNKLVKDLSKRHTGGDDFDIDKSDLSMLTLEQMLESAKTAIPRSDFVVMGMSPHKPRKYHV